MNIIRIVIGLFFVTISLSGYDSKLALKMMYMSAASYESISSINAWKCANCKYPLATPQVFNSSKSNIQGFTGYMTQQKAILIAFRGSQDIKNWITNLDTLQTNYPCTGCTVHKGFYAAYNQVSGYVRKHVQKLISLYNPSQIYITGHSLGGALAVLCTLEMELVYKKTIILYTMGQPRVGNSIFADHITSKISNYQRIVNYADIVTHLPPYSFSFVHGGRQIWYHPQGMQIYSDCVSESPQCANSLSTTSFSVNDHDLQQYKKVKTSSSLTEYLTGWLPNLLNFNKFQEMSESLVQSELNNINNVIENIKIEAAYESSQV